MALQRHVYAIVTDGGSALSLLSGPELGIIKMGLGVGRWVACEECAAVLMDIDRYRVLSPGLYVLPAAVSGLLV